MINPRNASFDIHVIQLNWFRLKIRMLTASVNSVLMIIVTYIATSNAMKLSFQYFMFAAQKAALLILGAKYYNITDFKGEYNKKN